MFFSKVFLWYNESKVFQRSISIDSKFKLKHNYCVVNAMFGGGKVPFVCWFIVDFFLYSDKRKFLVGYIGNSDTIRVESIDTWIPCQLDTALSLEKQELRLQRNTNKESDYKTRMNRKRPSEEAHKLFLNAVIHNDFQIRMTLALWLW